MVRTDFVCEICETGYWEKSIAEGCESIPQKKMVLKVAFEYDDNGACEIANWQNGDVFAEEVDGRWNLLRVVGTEAFAGTHLLVPVFESLQGAKVRWRSISHPLHLVDSLLIEPLEGFVASAKKMDIKARMERVAEHRPDVERTIKKALEIQAKLQAELPPPVNEKRLARDVCVKAHIQALKDVKAQMELERNDSGSERCWVCAGPPDHDHHIDYQNDITIPLCTRCHGRVHSILRRRDAPQAV